MARHDSAAQQFSPLPSSSRVKVNHWAKPVAGKNIFATSSNMSDGTHTTWPSVEEGRNPTR